MVDIACGSLHCVCCISDGMMFTWGDNDEGLRCVWGEVCVCGCVHMHVNVCS